MLFCWELGGGLGHMMQMLPLATDLANSGHRVLVALRQLERATEVFGGAGVRFLAAPAWNSTGSAAPHPEPVSFAQFLLDVGFGDGGELFARASAWRTLFDAFRPDLIVFDHAPTALLASRVSPMARAVIGSGFYVPPGGQSGGAWGVLRPAEAAAAPQPTRAADATLLCRLNRVLADWKQPPMDRLGRKSSRLIAWVAMLTDVPGVGEGGWNGERRARVYRQAEKIQRLRCATPWRSAAEPREGWRG